MTRSSRSLLQRLLFAAALVLAAWVASKFPQRFELDRGALACGEWWRMWTGHLVHGSADHFRYDVGAALLIGLALGRFERLLVWAPLLSAALLVLLPDMQRYHGLSGLLHGWVVFEAGALALSSRGAVRFVAAALAAGTLLKAGLETVLGVSFFTDGLEMGGAVLHASHWIGGALGLFLLLISQGVRRFQHPRGELPWPAHEEREFHPRSPG